MTILLNPLIFSVFNIFLGSKEIYVEVINEVKTSDKIKVWNQGLLK